ncbi:uncharacterized protein LOC114715273 [Neltuma alba]|uniref:uncharacterized protein LOC114714188 n=1 Tax=Neltuma alba TaxID=207710 RepID=UPI0010A52921|nr:uncharacterized protein LOC114714188 [Prosopis alba]XP_028755903.1 uncharacterized protein LOC114715273 [Prosopis alba]
MYDLWCDKISGSSNGFLCVEIDKYAMSPSSLLLCNPATREVRNVPRSRTMDGFKGICSLGFGFSPVIKEYKIVRTYAAQFNTEVNRVEVYSLSTGSWKEIEPVNLKRIAGIFYGETVKLLMELCIGLDQSYLWGKTKFLW